MNNQIKTAYGQTIALEPTPDGGHVVLTLEDSDGTILAQIGMEPHEYFQLIDGFAL